jgi:YD repeat-containing protein
VFHDNAAGHAHVVPRRFAYDALGRRASKSINGSVTQFPYDGLNPVQELDGSNPPNPTANLLTGLDIDEYFSRTDTRGAASFPTDALGSTIALTDSSGNTNTSYRDCRSPFTERTAAPFVWGSSARCGSSEAPYLSSKRSSNSSLLLAILKPRANTRRTTEPTTPYADVDIVCMFVAPMSCFDRK